MFFSNQKNIDTSFESKNKCFDNDENKHFEMKPKKFDKNIKASIKVDAHNYKCCKSKLNNSMYTFNLKLNNKTSIILDV